MPSIAQIAQAMRDIFQERAAIAARVSGFSQRERQRSGAQFVQTVVGSFLAHPDASYETMADLAADLGAPITPQGLGKRFGASAVTCLEQVLCAMTQQTMAADPVVQPLLDRFAAVTVEDSTVISLPDQLATQFPGCGGSRAHARAACKAQFRWELRSGRLDGPILQGGRAADRAVTFRVRAAAGTLRLRDLGYWQLDDLVQDDRDGRYWLTRLKPGTALFTADGQRHELLALLAPVTADLMSWSVQIGVRQHLACRLIARRVPADLAAARARQAAHTAKRKGRRLSPASTARCAGEVIVTNVPEALLSAAEAWIMLGVRWQIELLFKLWKSHGQLEVSHGVLPDRVLAELYAKFCALLLQHWLLLAGCWQQADRSFVKAARVVRRWAERLFQALAEGSRLEQRLAEVIAAIGRARRQTRRKQKPGTWQRLGEPQAVPESAHEATRKPLS